MYWSEVKAYSPSLWQHNSQFSLSVRSVFCSCLLVLPPTTFSLILWEKDFDLDMTEEEVQMALSKVEASGELEDVEWEDWE